MSLATLATGRIYELDEYQDVTLRIDSTRGSFPVPIVTDGAINDAEAIGRAVLSGFSHLVESPVYEAAKAQEATA